MSKKYVLREFFELCPDGICKDYLTEAEKLKIKQNGAVYLTGIIQTAENLNGNGRIYPRRTLEREISNYGKLVSERRSVGELDHPDDSVVNLKNVSHLIAETWWESNNVYGKIEVLPTPSGEILKSLIMSGVTLGISSRGLGSVKEVGGKTYVEDDYQLICFDIVQEPSTRNAFLNLREHKDLYNNSTGEPNNVLEIIDDILFTNGDIKF